MVLLLLFVGLGILLAVLKHILRWVLGLLGSQQTFLLLHSEEHGINNLSLSRISDYLLFLFLNYLRVLQEITLLSDKSPRSAISISKGRTFDMFPSFLF